MQAPEKVSNLERIQFLSEGDSECMTLGPSIVTFCQNVHVYTFFLRGFNHRTMPTTPGSATGSQFKIPASSVIAYLGNVIEFCSS